MRSVLSFVILSVIVIYSVQALLKAPIVITLNGPIKGRHYETVFGKNILAFHRIPYIKPPIGSLRFKDPQPVDNWTKVLDCSLPPIPSFNKNIMLEKFVPVIEGDETAIHINAYTAKIKPNKLRPVMVFIHGGGFISDSGGTRSYSPDYLLQKNLVLFTINYRLGVLGFLSLDDPNLQVPGNAGLKDQTMALRWIKNNCDRFGGDPNRITLFGQSAGGASVHFHALSELSRGLFHKAIVMSGTATSPFATNTDYNFALDLAKSFGWNEDEPVAKALEVLQNADATELLNAVDQLIVPPEFGFDILLPFIPVIEPYVSEQCFISKPVTEMMIDPWSKDTPFMVSSTSDEGLLQYLFINDPGVLPFFVPNDLYENNNERLNQIYYGVGEPAIKVMLISDVWVLRATYNLLQSRASNSAAPTYLLRFAFDSQRFNHFKVSVMNLVDVPGASHVDDLSYLFKNDHYVTTGGLPLDSREFITMQRMVDLYTNFAASSNPNGGHNSAVVWEPIISNNASYKCLNVGDDLEIIDWPEYNRMTVWNQLYGNN